TPLSSGIAKGLRARQAEIKKASETKPIMVLISDGRANVSMAGNIKDELLAISEQARMSGVHTIVVDTEEVVSSFMEIRLGYCCEMAGASGRRCHRISRRNSYALFEIVDREEKLLFEANT